MPTLFRFILTIGAGAALIFGAMWALVAYVEPEPHEISQSIASSRLNGK